MNRKQSSGQEKHHTASMQGAAAIVQQLFDEALRHHQAGRLSDAERLYRQVLSNDPNHADSLNLLGVLACQVGRQDAGAGLIGKAIEINGTSSAYHYNLGRALQELGRPEDAVACFRKALDLEPNDFASHNNLGNALRDLGRADEAVTSYRRALGLKSDYAEAYNNMGRALGDLRRQNEAMDCYRRALELKPDLAEAHNNLGIALADQGRLEEAVICFRRALTLHSRFALAHNNLGRALGDLGRQEEAIDCFRRALELRPDWDDAHINLGVALVGLGRQHEAVTCFRRVLDLRPDYPEAHYNLANSLCEQGHLDEAVACCRRALDLKPDYAEAYSSLGLALQKQGRLDEAVGCCRRALELKPDFDKAHNNLGVALWEQGRLDEAVGCYRRALALKADFVEAHGNLGAAFQGLGRLEEAVASFRRGLDIKSDDASTLSQSIGLRRRICDWREYQVDENRLVDLVRCQAKDVPPFIVLSAATTLADQLTAAQSWVAGRMVSYRPLLDHGLVRRHDKIRIGYLSPDFRQHATAFLMAELFECHDRSRFEVFGYSYGPDDGSEMRKRLVAGFDRFVDLRQSAHTQAATRIHGDAIDILVDLKGFTQDARTQILAYRPAPIQVNYLGYPATMGADFIDYILADPVVAPFDHQPFYSERIVHLPECYQPNDTKRVIADTTPSRTDCGLPADGIVFCCFNSSYKITPAFFGIWMRLLRAVPGSVLWLLEDNALVTPNLRHEAEARGVAPDRLVFAPRLPLAGHLSRHRQADLFLDTLPYNAHTTASDALWAGLPVLTCTGQTFSGRVASSLLRAMDLPELIASSLPDYEALALKLATEPIRLAAIKGKLAGNRLNAPLFDIARLTRHIEAAYARMWEIRCAGQPPTAFAVNAMPQGTRAAAR